MSGSRPVLSKDTIYDYLNWYEPAELLYKKYYESTLVSQELADCFLESLPPDELCWFANVLPIATDMDVFLRTPLARTMRQLADSDIIALKHLRYSPVFTHEHPVYEIFYVYEGSCTNIIQDHVMRCRKGDVCFIPPRVSHSISVFDDSLVINLEIPAKVFQNIFSSIFSMNNPLTMFYLYTLTEKGDKNYLLFGTGGDSRIRSIAEDIFLETCNPQKYTNAMMRTLFSSFLIHLIRDHESDLRCFFETKNTAVNLSEMMIYFQKNYCTISLSDAACHFGFSEAYFSRLVKKCTGQNFTHIIHKLKLENACRALHETNLQIQDVCDMIGFENPAHFSRAFKEAYGCTPRDYRSRLTGRQEQSQAGRIQNQKMR